MSCSITSKGDLVSQHSLCIGHQSYVPYHIYGYRLSTFILLFLAAVGCPDIAPPDGMWMKRQDDKTSVGCHVTREVWQLVCVDGEWLGSELTNCSKCKSSQNYLVLDIAWSVICLLDQDQIGKMYNVLCGNCMYRD